MEIYYYCSYTGSPVGFQLGRLDFESGKLSGENIPPLIRRCFSRGMICRACGRLPGEEKYFVLVKDLTAKKSNAADAEEYYINVAFVSRHLEDYRKWSSSGNMTQQALADMIRDTMSLHSDPAFGYTVRVDLAKKLNEVVLGNLFNGILPKNEATDFQVLSPHMSPEELGEMLSIVKADYTVEKLRLDQQRPGNWFRISKKKDRRYHRKAILIPIAALIVLAGLFMLLKALGK